MQRSVSIVPNSGLRCETDAVCTPSWKHHSRLNDSISLTDIGDFSWGSLKATRSRSLSKQRSDPVDSWPPPKADVVSCERLLSGVRRDSRCRPGAGIRACRPSTRSRLRAAGGIQLANVSGSRKLKSVPASGGLQLYPGSRPSPLARMSAGAARRTPGAMTASSVAGRSWPTHC